MAITTAAGISATTVTTDQQAPLGFELIVPNGDSGESVYIYIKAEDAIEVGELCMKKDGTATYENVKVAAANTPVVRLVGIAQTAIAAASYGFVLRKGTGSVQASDAGADQANEALVCAMHGAVAAAHKYNSATAAQHQAIFGFGHTNAAASAGSLFTATIDCRG